MGLPGGDLAIFATKAYTLALRASMDAGLVAVEALLCGWRWRLGLYI